MASYDKPELSYSINGFINSNNGDDEVTYHNFSLLTQETINDNTVQFAYANIIDDYIEELRENCVDVELSEQDKIKYFYAPDILSYDLYGTISLDFIIMKLNGIIDPKDFDLTTLKLIPNKEIMSELLSKIYSAEHSYIERNRETEKIVSSGL